MPSAADEEYRRFVHQRYRLLEELDKSRGQVDRWLVEHQGLPEEISDVAFFAGLLQQKKQWLEQLSLLDDTYVERLLELRALSKKADSTTS